MFPGASNAPGGITIDLRKLNLIAFDEETQTTEVGPGNRWADVYKVLEPLNKTVVGGRSSQVGVGGFILGGECPQMILEMRVDRGLRGDKLRFSPSRLGS